MTYMVGARLLLLSLVIASGCASGGTIQAANTELDPKVEAFGKQFGTHILEGRWADAYAMTTPQFQAGVTQAEMRDGYEALLREIVEDEPTFKPNMVDIDYSSLPTDEKDAADSYEVKAIPPKSSWKAWIFVGIGEGDGVIERGIDAMMLVVEEGGELKAGHVAFEFMD